MRSSSVARWTASLVVITVFISTIAGALTAAPPAPAPSPASRPATAPAKFKVATYNILCLNRDLKAVVETIRKADADFVAIQEANEASVAYFRKELGKDYPHIVGDALDPSGGRGLAILSRTPLTDRRYLPPQFAWCGTQFVTAQLGGRKVLAVNVHLISTSPIKADLKSMAALFTATEGTRIKEIKRIVENLPKDQDAPIIMLGDFNSPSRLSAPQYLLASGFIDSMGAITSDPDMHPTWRWEQRPDLLRIRLDYVFHTPQLRTLDCRIIPCDASDHYPVVSTLQWRPAGKVTLFGLTAPADNVVYISDCAGNMIDTFDTVRREIMESIKGLEPEQSFFVMFFGLGNGPPREMKAKSLLRPTTQSVKETEDFVKTIRPDGQTQAFTAVTRAFELLKDRHGSCTIYLVTCGDFGDNKKVIDLLATLNKDKKVKVNIILMDKSQETAKVLKKIAEDNGGQFKQATRTP
ncbi:MAG: endonuclease/exonuclease/phosphatase family protein [Phycisphaerae bacterium]